MLKRALIISMRNKNEHLQCLKKQLCNFFYQWTKLDDSFPGSQFPIPAVEKGLTRDIQINYNLELLTQFGNKKKKVKIYTLQKQNT